LRLIRVASGVVLRTVQVMVVIMVETVGEVERRADLVDRGGGLVTVTVMVVLEEVMELVREGDRGEGGEGVATTTRVLVGGDYFVVGIVRGWIERVCWR
jgi:hypothetical protein